MIDVLDGKMHMVCCKFYSTLEHNKKLLAFSTHYLLNGLKKHSERRMCKLVWHGREWLESFISIQN